MTTKLAGHLLVECLIAQGVTHAFGVPGESYLAVLDGFHAHAERIRFVTNRQEGGAAFMAEAQGKLSGRPGVCFVTRGPGATNASIGVHTAFQDSTPMILFVGDVASDARDREAFQEVDFAAFFGPATKGMAKRVERIDDARRLPEYVARAFATAMNGRPGPVVLVLPEDMLTEAVDAEPLPRVEPVQSWPDPGALQQLRELLVCAERPLVIAGGGGWTPEAAAALQRFAEQWQLPVANAFRFQDTFDNHHPLYAGDVGLGINPALARRVRESDLILAIGPRLGESTTGGYTLIEAPMPQQKLVHIHASAEELGRVYQPTLAICATMNAAARSLEMFCISPDKSQEDSTPLGTPRQPVRDAKLAPPLRRSTAWTAACHADFESNVDVKNGGVTLPGPVDMPAIVHTLQALLPPDAVLTNGAGNFASWLHRFYRYRGLVHGQKTQLAPTNGAMGYGVPAGIAASILTRRTVFTIAGDGDFLMTGQELATAVQYGARTIVLLVNNGSFGTIRMHQERAYPVHVIGSALENPDFCALARAYGYHAERVSATAEFEPAMRRALAATRGTVIELMLDAEVITTRGTLSAIRHSALQDR